MHFPIICIENVATPKEKWHEPDCEDACLNEYTDYYGEQYSEEERKEVINSAWFEDLFQNIAVVNKEKETITFLDPDILEKNIQKYLKIQAMQLVVKAEEKGLRVYDFWKAAAQYRGYDTLFYDCSDSSGYGYGKTSMDFIEDSTYHAGQTVKIGNIFDAHF